VARLTLVIDDGLLQRARRRALAEGTSVDAVVRETLASRAVEKRVLLPAHEGPNVAAVTSS